jgi:hypothetical protein
MQTLFYVGLFCSLLSGAVAEENALPKITEIRMVMQDGGMKREIQYRYTKTQLRIDRFGNTIPSPPINLVNLKTKTLRIIHPHNGTWEEGLLEEKTPKTDGFPQMPHLPAGIGPQTTPSQPAPPSQSVSPPPSESGSTPMVPPKGFPQMPEGFPTNLPAGVGPNATPPKAMPVPTMPAGMPQGGAGGMMPQGMSAFPMPPMGGRSEKPLQLIPLNQKTNTFCGVVCQQYKMELPRMGSLTLWLSDDPSLPPFYPLRYNMPDRRGHSRWSEKLGQLLRKEKKFPIQLELRGSGKDLQVQWKVLSIKPKQKQKDSQLFCVPTNLHKMDHF